MVDIVVIGAGCAGMTAGVYAARAGKKVLVLEAQGIGGQIAASPLIENYPGIPDISGMEFSDNLFAQAEKLGVEFDFQNVTGIKVGEPMKVVTAEGVAECKSIIIASGSKHRELGVRKERELTGHGVSYCAVCDGTFFKGKDVAVVGGGNTALSDAMYLAKLASHVTIIHRRDAFRADKNTASKLNDFDNITTEYSSVVKELVGEKSLMAIKLSNVITGEEKTLDVSGLFVAVGQQAKNGAFSNVIALDESGYILAGEDCVTSATGVFAAGDCRKKSVRQLTTAAADGSVAALAACDYISKHHAD